MRSLTDGDRRVVSKQMLYVEIDAARRRPATSHYAPYLDYRPLAEDEPGVEAILDRPECAWIDARLEQKAQGYAIAARRAGAPRGGPRPQARADRQDRGRGQGRLTKEINYWDHRAEQLKLQEQAGKLNARLNSGEARQRADDLRPACRSAWTNWSSERQISPLPPVVLGGLLVVPAGLLRRP